MNIGIDFDGVVFDSEKMFRAYSKIFNLKIDGGAELDRGELKAQKRYDWSEEKFDKFINECLLDILQNAPVMPCCKMVLNALAKKHNLYAITSRGALDLKEIDVTKQRLKQENLPFKGAIYSSLNKLEACKELKIDLMIDDLYDTVKHLSENGIKCLYFRDYILYSCKNTNVTEVHNWGDIAEYFCKEKLIDKKDLK